MPTSSARYPCLQLGLLKPTLERAGFAVEVFSLYAYFGSLIGWRLHEAVAEVPTCLAGEWIWAAHAFEENRDEDLYLETYGDQLDGLCRSARCTLEDLLRVRRELTGTFLDRCLDWTDWSRFGLVGFTVLFQQQMASLALARRIKERHPDLPVILGGGVMEEDLAREILGNCPQVDFVHCGEADEVLPEMVRRLYGGESMEGLPGLFGREGKGIFEGGRASNLEDMDRTPTPDYDEYFRAREEGGYAHYEGAAEPFVPIETSRGCWWGERSHCTFCGQNRVGIRYRSKSAPRVLEMFEELASRYNILNLDAVDNVLDPDYVEGVFGHLAEARADFKIVYAVRASLDRRQIARMRAGGLCCVQSGIESFSTHVLKLMRKGTTARENLELLKWTTYHGIDNLYNILVGFPGETPEDYREQCDLFGLIGHLQPPYAMVKARPDRGSPMFVDPAAFGITRLNPEEVYRFLWPPDRFARDRVAYFFTPEIQGALPDEAFDEIYRTVREWQERWASERRPSLTYAKTRSSIRIRDGRGGEVLEYRLAGREAELYESCGDSRTLGEVERQFRGPAGWIVQFLEESLHRGLMVFLDGRYLSLALPENPYHGL